jgi:hypothetical protein
VRAGERLPECDEGDQGDPAEKLLIEFVRQDVAPDQRRDVGIDDEDTHGTGRQRES